MGLNLAKNILLQGVKIMMKNKIMPAVVKGMLAGAVIGAGCAYVASMDMACRCSTVRKKAECAYRCMRRTAGKAMRRAGDRLYSV